MSIADDNNKYREQIDILKGLQTALGKKNDLAKDSIKIHQSLISVSSKLAQQEEDSIRLSDKQLDKLKSQAKEAIKQLESNSRALEQKKKLNDEENELLEGYKQGFKIQQDTVRDAIEEINFRKESNRLMGVGGNLLKGLNSIAGNFSKAFGLDEVEKKMQSVADKSARNNKSFGKLRVISAGVKESFIQLGNSLLSPTVLLTNMVLGFNKVDKAATGFQQLTGQNLNTAKVAIGQFNGGLITTAEYIKTASELTQEFGLNAAAVFTPKELMEAASMTKEMGLTAKESANLARFSKINGNNIEAQNEAIIDGVNSANRQNKTAVSHGMVLRDVANVSEGISISYATYPEKLGEAAAAARALGMDLGKVDAIASSLLKFETSISSELEAELLTGRSINLEKAREFALMNDMKGVATELANQGITSANFSKMNRIQQEAQAKALGMSRDEMARMLLQQEMNKDLSEGALNDAQKATLEDLKRVDAQEKIATAIGKLQQAFAPIIEIFANIVSHSAFIYSIMGVGLLTKFPLAIKFAKGFANNFKDAFKSVKGLVSGVAKMVAGGGTGKLKEFFRKPQMDGASQAQNLGNKMKPEAGKGIKSNLQGLAPGLRSMGTGPVLKGVVNLAAFGVASVPAIASIPFLLFMGLTPLKLIKSNMQSLAAGLRSMSKTFVGSLALGAFGVAATLAIPSLLFLGGIAALGAMGAAGLTALGGGLEGLGSLAATGIPFLGIALIAALGAAMIPFGYALNLAAPAIKAFGSVILSVFQGLGVVITSAAEGFTSMFGALNSDNIAGLLLLGPALLGISAGLAAMSITGLLAMPTILGLTALGSVAEGLGSIFGDNETTTTANNNEMAEVNANLKKLISVVEQGGDVYIDGAKVGKSLQLASSKVG